MTDTFPPAVLDLLGPEGLPASPGLRQRKKAAAMRRLQEIAVEQFEEHGFEQVTIEHIAEQAEVSPSTVYRYFGTKEGLVLQDEYDDLILEVFSRLLGQQDPWTAFATAMRFIGPGHFAVGFESSMRRTRIVFETPPVRAAGLVMIDEIAQQLAPMMHQHDHYGRSLRDYQVVAAALLAALFTCLEQWYVDGGEGDLVQDVVDAVELVRPAWATPAHP